MSTSALADDTDDGAAPYQTQVIPTCRVFIVPSVGEICGYQYLDDWRAVARADAELVLLRSKVVLLEGALAAERERGDLLAQALDVREGTVATLVASLAAERTNLIDLDRKYQDARTAPNWMGRIGWSAAIVVGGVLAGVLVFSR